MRPGAAEPARRVNGLFLRERCKFPRAARPLRQKAEGPDEICIRPQNRSFIELPLTTP